MARVLILGADGMVGHMARVYLQGRGHEVVSVARSTSPDWVKLDVEDTEALLEFTREAEPEIVLNCIGVLIMESAADPVRAIKLNALLPRQLAAASRERGFRLIHASSDCVFSGARGPYSEGDPKDSQEVYGLTKALGEVVDSHNLTIRTSKIGPEIKAGGSGLFDWLMRQKGVIRGFGKGIWGGVTTMEMAKAVDRFISHPVSGLLHLTNGEPISKYELLVMMCEIWGKKDVVIERDDAVVSDRSLLCTRTDVVYSVPSYRAMLEELHGFMIDHSGLYKFYV